MELYGFIVVLLGFLAEINGTRITLDNKAQAICKKYHMMCKMGKVCAVQHFDWPKNITFPVCIPLSFVPVRNLYCQLPPDPGRCHARYIRWHFNIHSQECSHFQFGGCEGNQNNFMSKKECEETCMATPTIKLIDGSHSALVQPSVIASPVYEQPAGTKYSYEALNSVQEPMPAHTFDRYQVARHRHNRVKAEEAATRTRRRLDKEKERKRKERERRRERKRLRRLKKKELKKKKLREQRKREKQEKKNRRNKTKDILLEQPVEDDNEIVRKDDMKSSAEVVKETKNMITNDLETEKEKRRRERRKERKRQRRREKKRKRRERERRKELEKINKNSEKDDDKEPEFAELVKRPDSTLSAKMFAILDQGKDFSKQRNSVLHST